jgi:hypothetical protein
MDATTAADRVVQAAVSVDVHTAVEEPAQPNEVFEIELVIDQILKSRPMQRVQQRRVGLFAGVIEGVLVTGRASVEQQPDQGQVAPLDRSEQRRQAPLPAPLDCLAVRVRSGI